MEGSAQRLRILDGRTHSSQSGRTRLYIVEELMATGVLVRRAKCV